MSLVEEPEKDRLMTVKGGGEEREKREKQRKREGGGKTRSRNEHREDEKEKQRGNRLCEKGARRAHTKE